MQRLVAAALEYRTHAAQLRHTSQSNHVRAVEEVALLARDVHACSAHPGCSPPVPDPCWSARAGHRAGPRLVWGTTATPPPPPLADGPRGGWAVTPSPPLTAPRVGASAGDGAVAPSVVPREPAALCSAGPSAVSAVVGSPCPPQPCHATPAAPAPPLGLYAATAGSVEMLQAVSVPPPAPRTAHDALAFARQAALQAAYRQRHSCMHDSAAVPHVPALPGALPVLWSTPVRQPEAVEVLVASGGVSGSATGGGVSVRLGGRTGGRTVTGSSGAPSRRPRASMLPPVPQGHASSDGESGQAP